MRACRLLTALMLSGGLATAAASAAATGDTVAPAPADAAIATPASPPSVTPARGAAARTHIPSRLARQAKVSLDDARATALEHLQNGTVRSQVLERACGKLIYSFDIAVPGRIGTTEVSVNAMTGVLVGDNGASVVKEAATPPAPKGPSGKRRP